MANARYFVGDFETTVYKGQEDTEVWASALVEMYSEDVQIHHSISETFDYLTNLNCSVIVYYHNLKFDGSFWLSFLLIDKGFKQALEGEFDNERFEKPFEMPNNSFAYSISSMGQWYRIIIRVNRHTIELRDSLKLLPFSVERIGSSFGTKHRKLNMNYEGFRYAGCTITDEEKRYIANDVLVVKEALEIMFDEGHKKLTIGSCCLSEYKKSVGGNNYEEWFPDLYTMTIPEVFGAPNAGEYIRKSYHGGWCYVVKGKENQIKRNGTTADVNSLYPSMMSSESLNLYPIGLPTFWQGNYIPDEALAPCRFYFVRFRTQFYIKDGMLPFVQIKNTFRYSMTEMLETSDILNPTDGKYYNCYYDTEGNLRPAYVELTMTQMDFELLKKHYELVNFEILDGCYFDARVGIFDRYIEKYKQIKLVSKGAKRELAKLFLNNLYGKMASSTNSNFKIAFQKEDGSLGFRAVTAHDKKPGYIPVGSAITSYARNFTIKAAQANYHGANERGFIYADTDSIHCDLLPEEIQGIKVHPKNFCCWKLESCWDVGYFVRQKTYIEHITHEDEQPIEHPYYNVKCAGMPERCKHLFLMSMNGYTDEEFAELNDEEKAFVSTPRTLEDFNVGLCVPSKLRPKRIRGGVLLVPTTYEMR